MAIGIGILMFQITIREKYSSMQKDQKRGRGITLVTRSKCFLVPMITILQA